MDPKASDLLGWSRFVDELAVLHDEMKIPVFLLAARELQDESLQDFRG